MNELQRKAELYAAEKMNELMTKAIAQAYMDGYKDRYSEIMKPHQSTRIRQMLRFNEVRARIPTHHPTARHLRHSPVLSWPRPHPTWRERPPRTPLV